MQWYHPNCDNLQGVHTWWPPVRVDKVAKESPPQALVISAKLCGAMRSLTQRGNNHKIYRSIIPYSVPSTPPLVLHNRAKRFKTHRYDVWSMKSRSLIADYQLSAFCMFKHFSSPRSWDLNECPSYIHCHWLKMLAKTLDPRMKAWSGIPMRILRRRKKITSETLKMQMAMLLTSKSWRNVHSLAYFW